MKKKRIVEVVSAPFFILEKGVKLEDTLWYHRKKRLKKWLKRKFGIEMSKQIIVEAGESVPFNFDRGENSINGWTCTISVKKKASDTSFITPRVIAESKGSWPGFLTQSETAILATGDYFLSAKLENVTTDEEEVVREQSRFRVTAAWT